MPNEERIVIGETLISGLPITAKLMDSQHFTFNSKDGDLRWEKRKDSFVLAKYCKSQNTWYEIPCFDTCT